MILRDRDASTAWADEADSTREQRVYYCQNWRADVVALLSDSGKMLEWAKYSAYGVPFALPAGDIDSDGDFDATDVAGTTGAYDVRKDSELDGDVDFNDIYHAAGIAGAYQTLGRGVLTSPAIDNRRGYAGYESDPTFAGANGGGAAARTIYHVRHRVYDADVGRWTRRDPLGYSDGMSLYEYVRSQPILRADPRGLASAICASGSCGAYPPDSERWPGGRGPGIPPRCPSPPPPPPSRAPYPIIDPSCTTNPLEPCKDDLLVKAALGRYYADCASSSRGTLTIECGTSNKFDCRTNTITVKNTDCGTLAHEILHAADFCRNNDKCDLWDPNNRQPYCEFWMCTEARAASRGSCCDPNNPWRRGRDWAACVTALRDWYLDNSGTCGSVTRAVRAAAWNRCAASDEANACSGNVPAIQ